MIPDSRSGVVRSFCVSVCEGSNKVNRKQRHLSYAQWLDQFWCNLRSLGDAGAGRKIRPLCGRKCQQEVRFLIRFSHEYLFRYSVPDSRENVNPFSSFQASIQSCEWMRRTGQKGRTGITRITRGPGFLPLSFPSDP